MTNLKLTSVKKIHKLRTANNMKFIFYIILFLNLKAGAQSCQSQQSNLSAIASAACSTDSIELIDKLKSQGFRCDSASDNSSRRGRICSGKLSPYTQSVRIYVSPYYQKKSEPTISMHFHGHRLTGIDTFQTKGNDMNGHGDYGARLVDSKSTDLLVIPESTGKCADYVEFNNAEVMKKFTASLEEATGLKSASYRLSAHSGGAKVVNAIINNQSLNGRVKSVGLFDAIYQEQAGVIKFLKASSKNTAVIAYLENGSTQNQTAAFISATKDLKSQVQIHPISQTKSSHMMIMNQGQFTEFLSK